MRTSLWLPMVLTLTAGSALLAQAGDDGGSRPRRAVHDVAVSLGKVKPTRAGSRVKVRLKNRGRSFESGVQVSLWSDAQPATPVWEATADVRRGGHETWKLVLELPAGTTALTASCDMSLDTDEDESNDDDVVEVPPGAGGGGTGDVLAIEGAKIWMPLCSGCHGADGTGGTVDENISDEDAGDILEAVREGEEAEDDEPGMPRFPELDFADAQAIAAFLRNPDATVPTDPPPTDPPPTDPPTTPPAAPTYANDVSVILSQYCTACHTGTSAAAKVRLDNYSNASANATKSVNAIASGKMPPGGGTFPPEDLQILRDWISGGSPR